MRGELFRTRSRQWCWRVRSSNGRILANAADQYRNRRDAVRMFRKLFPTLTLVVK